MAEPQRLIAEGAEASGRGGSGGAGTSQHSRCSLLEVGGSDLLVS